MGIELTLTLLYAIKYWLKVSHGVVEGIKKFNVNTFKLGVTLWQELIYFLADDKPVQQLCFMGDEQLVVHEYLWYDNRPKMVPDCPCFIIYETKLGQSPLA